jgi:GNAT superfamily N-acetyltransferase
MSVYMEKQIIVRPARPEEADELTKLSFRSKAYWGYPNAWLTAWTQELTVTKNMVENWITYVVEVNLKIVGFWGRSPIESETTSPGLLFIAPEHMGQGYGRLLGDAIKKAALERGVRFFTVEADPNATSFYLKIGGKNIGDQPSLIIPGRICSVIRFDLI